jgi:hypothetical protein
MPTKNPPHPGDFIRTEIIEAAGLTVTAATEALRVSRPALSSLLKWQGRPFRGYGTSYREGFRREWKRSCGCSRPTTSLKPASARSKSMCGALPRSPVLTRG